jgi:hypothetical protein
VRLDPSDTDLRQEFSKALAYIRSASELVDQIALLVHYLEHHIPYNLEENRRLTRTLEKEIVKELSKNTKSSELLESERKSYTIVRIAQLGEIIKNKAAVCLEKAMFGHVLLAELGIKTGLRYGISGDPHEWLEVNVQIEEGMFAPEKTVIDPTSGKVGNFVNSEFEQYGPAQFLVKPKKELKKPKEELKKIFTSLVEKYFAMKKLQLPEELLSHAEKSLQSSVLPIPSFISSESIEATPSTLPESVSCAALLCDRKISSRQLARFCPECKTYRCLTHGMACEECGEQTTLSRIG